ncbi:MAG: polymerase [Archangium gephyra]|uniref:Polymerase n=1 Tax=Archangium gephyra TaxID=48 RepID=A0A2W5TBW6_9BACT|nr:MAG: polymerase [Archangium gephyra]
MGVTLLLLALLTQTPEPDNAPATITGVEVRLPVGADRKLLERVPQLITVRKGQTLSRRAVERSIESLFATNKFADIEVLAQDGEGGVEIIFLLEPRKNVGSIFVEGHRALSKNEVLAVTKLEPGAEYWPERLEQAGEAVRALYVRRGYHAVRVRTEAVMVEGSLSVGFVIDEGEAARVRSISFSGEPGLPLRRLLEAIDLEPGDVLDMAKADQGLERVRKLLREERFYRARVDLAEVTVDGRLVVPIVAGPRYDVVFSGNRMAGDMALTNLLAYDGDETLDTSLTLRLQQRLERFYRYRGYHDARVRVSEVLRPGAREAALGFEIEEGHPLRVTDVTFEGADKVNKEELRQVLRNVVEVSAPVVSLDVHGTGEPTDVAGRVSPEFAQVMPAPRGDTVLVEEAWLDATRAMAALYRERGYLRVKVTFAGAEISNGVARGHFVIEEGPQARYRVVNAEGLPPGFKSDTLSQNRVGTPFSAVELARIERDVSRELGRQGYLFADLDSGFTLDDSGQQADAFLTVKPGPQVKVRAVLPVGQVRTAEDVILKQATMKEGRPLDSESLFSTQANLQSLNIFRNVQVEMLSPERPEPLKTVLLKVRERPLVTLDPSFGYFFADGVRVAVDGAVPNIGGRAITLTGRGQLNLFFLSYPALTRQIDLSDLELWRQIGGRLNASLDAPSLLPAQLGLRFDAVLERVFRPQFRFSRAAGGATLNWAHSFDSVPRIEWMRPKLTLALTYEMEWSFVESVGTALTSIPPTSLVDQERLRFLFGEYTLHGVRFSPALDLRDNALTPHRGLLIQGLSEITGAISARDEQLNPVTVNFLKLSGQVTGYIPIGERVVLAVSLRGGRIFPLQAGSTTPPVRRFFLGGATSVRGFNEDQLIAEDSRERYRNDVRDCQVLAGKDGCSSAAKTVLAGRQVPSQGGELFGVFKTELRFPAFSVFDMGVFFEAGNLWLQTPTTLNLRPVVGLGLRYGTPIGPLALDLGFNLTPDTLINEPPVVLHFNIGGF